MLRNQYSKTLSDLGFEHGIIGVTHPNTHTQLKQIGTDVKLL